MSAGVWVTFTEGDYYEGPNFLLDSIYQDEASANAAAAAEMAAAKEKSPYRYDPVAVAFWPFGHDTSWLDYSAIVPLQEELEAARAVRDGRPQPILGPHRPQSATIMVYTVDVDRLG